MSSTWRTPNRVDLAKFLSNPKDIKAFEALFATAEVVTPELADEVLNLILSAEMRPAAEANTATQLQQITDMIGAMRREFASNLGLIRYDIESLKMGGQRANLSDIETRLKSLEEYTAGIR